MAVHTIRIESTALWNVVEIRSAATWARAPRRTLRYEAKGLRATGTWVEIDDRTVRLDQATAMGGTLVLDVQIATADDRVTLLTRKGAEGIVRLHSAIDVRVDDRKEGADEPREIVLFLDDTNERSEGVAGVRGDDAHA